ncbi:hypothetical protein ACET3Z_000973 [Daucus carota]
MQLTPYGNSSWVSPSGLYAFGFYQRSYVGIFLAGHPRNKAVVWTANLDVSPIALGRTRCDPKGLCGNNGYCTLIDNGTEAKCECPPGFYYVNKTASCDRVHPYTVEDCQNKEQQFQNDMERLDKVTWDNEPYPVHKINVTEAFEADCECDAAFFKNGLCLQLRLPLRYGRRISTDPIIADIKLASPIPRKKEQDTKGHQSVILVEPVVPLRTQMSPL